MQNETLLKLGQKMKELRLNQKLTLRQLASKLGICFTTIQSWEIGKCQPRIDHLERFCKFFGVTIEDLWK